MRAKGTSVGPSNSEQIQKLRGSILRWSRLWGVPQFAEKLSLRTSTRFRRSLGSYRAGRAEITLAAWLVDGPTDLLEEVLCHEVAHAAVHFVCGERVRPHGQEWRGFMKQADIPARVRIPVSELPESRQIDLAKTRVWEHRCLVCQATRFARTRVTRWRCSRCRDEGRSGELVIERVASPIAVDG
jgi:predicted SprT family Zn-dependent metalloprotease